MAPRLTRDERTRRVVDACRLSVAGPDGPPTCLSSAPKRRLRVLLERAGYKNATESVLDRINAELEESRVGTFPDLTDPTIGRDDWIYFYDLDQPIERLQPHRVLFNREAEMEDFFVANFKAMEFFRKRRYRLIGRQVEVASSCKVDLLAEHGRTGELVGIELKAAQPDDRLLAQVNKYLPALADRAAKDDRPGARLIVFSGQPDSRIVDACRATADRLGVALEWHLYKLRVEMSPVIS